MPPQKNKKAILYLGFVNSSKGKEEKKSAVHSTHYSCSNPHPIFISSLLYTQWMVPSSCEWQSLPALSASAAAGVVAAAAGGAASGITLVGATTAAASVLVGSGTLAAVLEAGAGAAGAA